MAARILCAHLERPGARVAITHKADAPIFEFASDDELVVKLAADSASALSASAAPAASAPAPQSPPLARHMTAPPRLASDEDESGAAVAIADAVDPASFNEADGKRFERHHPGFVKKATQLGYTAAQGKLFAAASAPWTGTAGVPYPFGQFRGAEGSRAFQLMMSRPASIPAGTNFNASFITSPLVISPNTGDPADHGVPGVIPGKTIAFRWRQMDFNGRTITGSTVNPGPDIPNTEALTDAVVWGFYWLDGEDTSFTVAGLGSLPADRWFAVQAPEIFDVATPMEVLGMSVKLVNTTKELNKSGSCTIGRQRAPVRTERFRSSGMFESTPVAYTQAGRTDVLTIPPQVFEPQNALNLQATTASAKDGFLFTVPMDYVDKAMNLGKVDSGPVMVFDRVSSWDAGAQEYRCAVPQGMQGSGRTTDWDTAAPYLDTQYTEYKKLSDYSCFAILNGLDSDFSGTLVVHIQYMSLPTRPTDPITAFTTIQDPLDIEFLQNLTRASEATKLWSPSDANGFGDFLRDAANGLGNAIKPLVPVAKLGLSIASQMPGPVGKRAQMADRAIKAVTGARDGAKAAARNPAVRRAGEAAAARNIAERRKHGGGRGASSRHMGKRVEVMRESGGALDVRIPRDRL